MNRLRAKAAAFCRRLISGAYGASQPHQPLLEPAARIVDAIFHREQFGKVTTMRHLPHITGLNQSAALRAVAELERSEMVEIHRDIHDTLASKLELTDGMRRSVAKMEKRSAA